MKLSTKLEAGEPINVDSCHNAPSEEVTPYGCYYLENNDEDGVIAYRDLSGNLVPFIFYKRTNKDKAHLLELLLNQSYMMGLANSKGLYSTPNKELHEDIQKMLKETNLL